jgi:broad specificity phosphatase PhoE
MPNREMTYLYLIRHCETFEPGEDVPPPPLPDRPLSQLGIQQAEELARFLRAVPIDLILTSLYRRAQETAALINDGRVIPVFASMALNEYFLRPDGRGVESTELGLARSLGFLLQFSPYYERIAVVAHSAILATLYRSYLNKPFHEFEEFGAAGLCRMLRYDYSQGDQNWREIETFTPRAREA